MKKMFKPGFEFIFSLSLIAILGLPPLVLAQSQKNIEIKIVNGDTTVNGKNIRKMNAAERKDALAAIEDAPMPPAPPAAPGKNNSFTFKRDNNGKDVTIEKEITTDNNGFATVEDGKAEKRVRLKRVKTDSAFTYRFDNDLPPMEVRINRFTGPGHKTTSRNSQSFNYTNTDGDGITTNVSYNVNDAPADKLKALTGTDKATLEIADLNLNYEFSTAKTILSLNLPAGAKDIKLTASNGTVVWADKATNTSFSKKFALPVNGVYYLQVKQGSKVALKKIVKE
jgi:hypothetical protein